MSGQPRAKAKGQDDILGQPASSSGVPRRIHHYRDASRTPFNTRSIGLLSSIMKQRLTEQLSLLLTEQLKTHEQMIACIHRQHATFAGKPCTADGDGPTWPELFDKHQAISRQIALLKRQIGTH